MIVYFTLSCFARDLPAKMHREKSSKIYGKIMESLKNVWDRICVKEGLCGQAAV